MGGPRFHYSDISSAPFGLGYVEYVGEITNTSDRDYQTAVFNVSFYYSQG
jgi:hypothetical protein